MAHDMRAWALRGTFDAMMERKAGALYWIGRFLSGMPDGIEAAALAHAMADRNADLAIEAGQAYLEFKLLPGKKVCPPSV